MSFFELVRIVFVWVLLAGLAGAVWFLLKNSWEVNRAESDEEEDDIRRQNRKGLFASLGVVLAAALIAGYAGSISLKEKAKVEAAQKAVEAAQSAKRIARVKREELAQKCPNRRSPREQAAMGACDGQGARGSESIVGSASCFADLNEFDRKCREAGY